VEGQPGPVLTWRLHHANRTNDVTRGKAAVAKLLGISPAQLVDPRRTRERATPPPPPYQPVDLTWLGGTSLTARMIRPGIAACHDLAVVRKFAPGLAQQTLPAAAQVKEWEFIVELDRLVERIEQSPTGQRLVRFLGLGRPLPDPGGSYGPDSSADKMNPRALFPHPRGPKDAPVGVNVLILHSTHAGATIFGLADPAGPSKSEPSSNGYGRFSVVAFHPRALLLVDDVAMPPELVLAHELIHAAHHLAGSVDNERLAPQVRVQIEVVARELAESTFNEKYRPTTWAAVEEQTKGKDTLTPKQKEQVEYFTTMLDVARKKLTNPIPVAEGPGGNLITIGGVDWEEHRTHGNHVAMEWHDGMAANGGVGVARSRLERQSEDMAKRYLAQAAAEAASQGAKAVTAALDRAYATVEGRRGIRGLTEVGIARELRLRRRVAYDPLTGHSVFLHSALARADLPAAVFTAAATPTLAPDLTFTKVDVRLLQQFSAALKAVDAATAKKVDEHGKAVAAATVPTVAAQRLCNSPRASQPPASAPSIAQLLSELTNDATRLVNQGKSTKPGPSKSVKESSSALLDLIPGAEFSRGEPTQTKKGVAFIAMVPATIGNDANATAAALKRLADLYRDTGFDQNQPVAERPQIALVIGLNVYENPQNPQGERKHIQDAIRVFGQKWTHDDFPVRVFGFVWHRTEIDTGKAKIGQDTIPYGEIRGQIATHPCSVELDKKLCDRGCENVYLHTGDDDAQSLLTTKGGLFSAAYTLFTKSPLNIFSGGYQVKRPTSVTKQEVLTWLAITLDLAVRGNLAKVDPRTVYYPEPNTFVTLPSGMRLDKLDKDDFGFGSQEGWKLVQSISRKHGPMAEWGFDAQYAVATDPRRIAKRFENQEATTLADAIAVVCGPGCQLTQSHAAKESWKDQIRDKYLGEILGITGKKQELAKIADTAFAAPGASTLLKATSWDDFKKEETARVAAEYKELKKDDAVATLIGEMQNKSGKGENFARNLILGTRLGLCKGLLGDLLSPDSLLKRLYPAEQLASAP
jgi:hypothetical protein